MKEVSIHRGKCQLCDSFSISDFLGASHLTSAMRDFQVMASRKEGRLV